MCSIMEVLAITDQLCPEKNIGMQKLQQQTCMAIMKCWGTEFKIEKKCLHVQLKGSEPAKQSINMDRKIVQQYPVNKLNLDHLSKDTSMANGRIIEQLFLQYNIALT